MKLQPLGDCLIVEVLDEGGTVATPPESWLGNLRSHEVARLS